MSYDDWVSNFQRLEICYLGPDSMPEDDDVDPDARKWEGNLFEGGWKRRVNAGGCRNNICMFLFLCSNVYVGVGMCRIDILIFVRFLKKKLRFGLERVWFGSVQKNLVPFGYYSYFVLV